MNPNELFIEFGSILQRKAFQTWLEKGGGFDAYLQFAATKMPEQAQPSCLSSNEFGKQGEHGTIEIE